MCGISYLRRCLRDTSRITPIRGFVMKPDRIRAIQKAKGITARQMANLVGVPKRTMESYLQGLRNPPEWVVIGILALERSA
jgi:DNA-binding transcriptional regulator YiaG